ncbi:SusC/RagA family TonB-linked outer membrane protein [Cyclobacterium salsum]|uniref:SusC/RagA family TonB-linked outer membrane protein n=1 Tax=Cyclobacterium salsum TaxID=2666329 RepID=UPI001F410BF2|nr:TonB-dependent receptor [Cyclobacterium salsum]
MKRVLLSLALMLLAVISLQAQSRTVTGKVTSEDEPGGIPGVNVSIKGTMAGTITDIDGSYSLTVPEGSNVLVFSFVGFIPQEKTVGNQSRIDVFMEPDVKTLGEVVVVGYGTQSSKLSVQSISTLDNSQIEGMPIFTAQEALQGQAAGVQLTGTSGVGGAQQNIRIRGVASLTAGGSPLFVVDGVPLNDGSSDDYSNTSGAVALNPLMEINPNEIESISVLKDASAVAIYGSRGANGVILIETKKGKSGQSRINVDYYQGVQNPTTERPYMSLQQYNQYRSLRTETPVSEFPQQGFDWPEAVIQQGSISNLNVSASGGSESTTYFISGTYFNQDTYALGNELDRFNGRLNMTHKFSEKARFGANIGLAKTDNDRIYSDNSTYAPLTSAFLHLPYNRPFDDNGNYTRLGFVPNLLAIEELATTDYITRRTTANTFFEVDILPDLTFKTDWGIDQIQTEETFRFPDIVEPTGSGYKRIIQDYKWLSTNTLNYENYFGDHYIGGLLGYSYEQADFSSITVEGSGFVSDQLPNVASAATPTITSATGTNWKLASYFARVNYRYDDKYLFEGSARRDGSSRFGADNRYGNFWALSGGWVISEEGFLQSSSLLNYLKLNVSYGTAGNDRISNFESLGLYQAGTLGDYAGSPGIYPSQPANPQLGWEESAQFDFTVNASLLDNRLDIEASVWNKDTEGLLLDVPIPYTTGYASLTQNAGSMRNRGIDLMVQSTNIQTSDFEWKTILNAGFLKNEVLELPGASEDSEGRRFVEGSASQRAIEGHPVNTFYLVRYNGINPETGEAEWLTKDGETTNTYSANDRVIVGSAIPRISGGLTNSFTYKGLVLSALITFVEGNYIMYDDLRFLNNPNNLNSFNLDPQLLDYWTEDNRNSFAPKLNGDTQSTFAQRSTQQLRKGDHIRLRNLSLSYTIPTAVLANTKIIRSARIYGMLQNFLTFSSLEDGLEPEVNDGGGNNQRQGESFFTPAQAKSVTLGVSLGF